MFEKRLFFAMLFCAWGMMGFAQETTFKGTVKDQFGDPLTGVYVIVGKGQGTVTDLDGNFSVNAPAGSSLEFTYIGFKPLKLKGSTNMNIVMEEDNTTLEDAVVVGYSTMKRRDLTGAVASVTGDKLAAVPVANVAEALQGKLAGVQITAQDGRPAGEMSIRVRGGGSITQSNDPLFIVDGVAVSSIDDIPADNIESIDVLKDASSTAIYGARGANGVILVTTKAAKDGKPVVKYNMYYQIKAEPKLLKLQDAYTYVRDRWEYMQAVGYGDNMAAYYGLGSEKGNHLNDYHGVDSHNYMDDVYRSGHVWNHDLSLSGGTDKTRYYAAVNYLDDVSTMKKSGHRRWNVNVKLQQSITKNLKLDVDARYNEARTQLGKYFNGSSSNISNTVVYPWMFNMIDKPLGEGGTTNFGEGNYFAEQQYNPVAVINDNDFVRKRQRVRLHTALTWEIIPNLSAKTELSLSRNWTKSETWTGPNTGRDLVSSAKLNQGDGYGSAWTTTLNYDFKELLQSDIHSLNVLVGNEVLGSRSNNSTMYGYKFPASWGKEEAFGQIQMAQNRNQSYSNNDIGVSSHTISWFGRTNYTLMDRYLFTFTLRADGSSKFAKGNRWGYFPAGAVAWRISEEPFLAETRLWLDILKLRLSLGMAGNDGISASAFNDEWVTSQNADGSFIYTTGNLKGNPDLKWEKTISRNMGIDYSFLNGKFNGSVDFYWNTTKDCLMRVPVNSTSGFSYMFMNAATTSNKGIEFALNYNIVERKDFGLKVGLVYNYNVNKVEKVPADANMDGEMRFATTSMNPSKPYVIREDEPVGLIIGYKADGFYKVEDFNVEDGVWTLKDGVEDCTLTTYHGSENYQRPEGQSAFPGMPKYQDTNNDGTVDAKDATIIGRMLPKHTGGFNFSGHYKSFDFSANFTYQLDGKVFNANYARTVHSGNNTKWSSMSRLATKFDNHWRMYNTNEEGDLYAVTDPAELARLNEGAKYGLLGYVSNDAPIVSNHYVESAAYLRLQSLTLGYTFPKTLTGKIGISNLRVYFTGSNLFCITGYDGLDPDVNTNAAMDSHYAGFPTPGFDYNSYPRSRTFTFGVNVTF